MKKYDSRPGGCDTIQEVKATLIENVQFIYELALAKLELEALGVNCDVTIDLREFTLTDAPDIDKLVKRLAYFKAVDSKVTDYYRLTRQNRTKSVNQYLTHWIYPYKGKFHPQMIRALINVLQLQENETLLDPFMGSGTTAVEAQLLGIACIGVDISPLCVLQSRVKTESMTAIREIRDVEKEALDSFSSSRLDSTSLSNYAMRSYDRFLDSIDNQIVRDFYAMAKLVAISDKERRGREIVQSFSRNLELMMASVEDYATISRDLGLRLGAVEIRQGDSRDLQLEDESVQGIITSPPYSIALDYVANDAHALSAMGYDSDEMKDEFIGVRGKGVMKTKLYNDDMKKSLAEMHRVLEKKRCCAIVIGDATYQGVKIRTVDFTKEQCEKLGFALVKNINKIIYGLYNVMQTENTLIFRKDK